LSLDLKNDNQTLSSEKCKDSGLALVLVSLICYQVWKQQFFIVLAIAFLLVAMTYPPIFKPFARFWFALSTALGTVVSKVILTITFFLMVLPVGLVRRAMGKDAMRFKDWKNGKDSVFRTRGHRFTAGDMDHPY
jgi:multisubunit Na+/H+ antiporter MnhG subunit